MSTSPSAGPGAGQATSPPETPAGLAWPALAVAVAALAGSVWLSVGMGLKACPLCFYQRTFVMGVVGVLATGLLLGKRHQPPLNLLALPMAVGGFAVALFHVWLELSGKLECPAGLLGLGSAPQQSLAALSLLLAAVAAGVVRGLGSVEGAVVPAAAAACLVGLLLALASVASAPPPPPVPDRPYGTPLDTCRPPYRGGQGGTP